MKMFISLISLLTLNYSLALPRSVEVWFLAEQIMSKGTTSKKGMIQPIFTQVAVLEMKDIPYVDGDDEGKIPHSTKPQKSSNPLPNDLIYCDQKSHFSFFCGPATHPSPQEKRPLEIWVDISASMKYVDPLLKDGSCYRKKFLQKMDVNCRSTQYSIYLFNTQLKRMGSKDELCGLDGLNDYQRLLQWIKSSNAQKLLIITDVFEIREELLKGLKNYKATLKGDLAKSLPAEKILNLSQEISSICQ